MSLVLSQFPIRITPDKKQASVIDAIVSCAGYTPKRASEIVARMTSSENENKIDYYRFSGSTRQTPVADAQTCVRILWTIGGEKAKKLRKDCSIQICRLLGADSSLIKEIELKSESIPEVAKQFFMESVKSASTEEEANVVQKRKASVLETDLDLEERNLLLEERREKIKSLSQSNTLTSLDIYNRTQQMDIFKNDAHLQSLARDILVNGLMKPGIPLIRQLPFCPDLSEILKTLSYLPKPGEMSKIGRALAKKYREEFREEPPTTNKYINGSIRMVKTYPAHHEVWVRNTVAKIAGDQRDLQENSSSH